MKELSTSNDVVALIHSAVMTAKLIRIARLKKFAKDRGIEGPVALGQAIGRKTNQASDLISGRASFGEKVARSIEGFAGLPAGWLDDDEGGEVTRAVIKGAGGSVDHDTFDVPLLAVAGSMGPGSDVMPEEVVIGRLTVSPQWVSRTIKPLTSLENLRFIHGYGDSMDPTFADGDILLVDIGVNAPKIDGVYVMEANDRIYIKRVRQRIDGSFEISSDNPTVKTVDVLDGSRPVEVRGRVVWAWNGKKL